MNARIKNGCPIRRGGIVVRPYCLADEDCCVAIWRSGSELGHAFLNAAELDADEVLVRTCHLPSAEILVATHNGNVAGFIALSGCFIGALFVHPAMHRTGVGTWLIDHVAVRHPVLEVEVYEENLRARAFYEARGFNAVSRRLHDDRGRPHALLRLQRLSPDSLTSPHTGT